MNYEWGAGNRERVRKSAYLITLNTAICALLSLISLNTAISKKTTHRMTKIRLYLDEDTI